MCQHLDMGSSENSATSTGSSNGFSNWILVDGTPTQLDAGQNIVDGISDIYVSSSEQW